MSVQVGSGNQTICLGQGAGNVLDFAVGQTAGGGDTMLGSRVGTDHVVLGGHACAPTVTDVESSDVPGLADGTEVILAGITVAGLSSLTGWGGPGPRRGPPGGSTWPRCPPALRQDGHRTCIRKEVPPPGRPGVQLSPRRSRQSGRGGPMSSTTLRLLRPLLTMLALASFLADGVRLTGLCDPAYDDVLHFWSMAGTAASVAVPLLYWRSKVLAVACSVLSIALLSSI